MKKAANMKLDKIYAIFFSALCIVSLNAQTERTAENGILQSDWNNKIDQYFTQNPDIKFHSSFRPYLYLTLRNYRDTSLNIKSFPVDHHYAMQKTIVQKPNYRSSSDIQIIPIAELQAGYDMLRSRFVSETGGGIYFRNDINHDFSASFTLLGGKSSFPVFTDTIVKESGIIPGMGLAYGSENNYAWTNFSGYLSYTPKSLFNFQLGQGKHFIGDGYRSLLLSDVANNYPYFRTSINVWKIQYSCWYSWFRDIYGAGRNKADFKNRFGTFHYLSINLTKNINVSLFESIIWQGTDSNRVRTFDVNYLNPVIFFRPVEYSVGSSDNAFIGMNFSWKIARTLKLYVQAVADEFYMKEIRNGNGWWANKQGVQAGFKYFNAFKIKNLLLQAEFNTVRPYTYSHGSPQQSYTHFNQPLAHPMGANFKETIGIISYRKKRFGFDIKSVYAVIGKDTTGSSVSMGQNVFLSYIDRPTQANGAYLDYGHRTTQGVKTFYFQTDVRLTYYLIPDINLRAELGFMQTNLSNVRGFDRQAPFIYFGIRSGMHNFYRDF